MNMALCLSHPLTDEQILDARQNLGVTRFIDLPERLTRAWQQVPPEPDVPRETLSDIIAFLERETSADDYVLVQGEFGLTFAVVDGASKPAACRSTPQPCATTGTKPGPTAPSSTHTPSATCGLESILPPRRHRKRHENSGHHSGPNMGDDTGTGCVYQS